MRKKLSAIVVALAATISLQGCDVLFTLTTAKPTPITYALGPVPIVSPTPKMGTIDVELDPEDPTPAPTPTRNPALFDTPWAAILPTPTPTPTPRFPLWTKKGDLGFPYEFGHNPPATLEYFAGSEWTGAYYYGSSRHTYYGEPGIRRDTVSGIAIDRKTGKVVIEINGQDLGKFPELATVADSTLPLLPVLEVDPKKDRNDLNLLGKTAILFTLWQDSLSFLRPGRRENWAYGNSEGAVRAYAPYGQSLNEVLNETKTVTAYDKNTRVLTLADGLMDIAEATIEPGISTRYYVDNFPFKTDYELDKDLYRADSLFAHDKDKLFFFRSVGIIRPDYNKVVWGKVRTRVDGKKELRLTEETKLPFLWNLRVLSAAASGSMMYVQGDYQTVPCSEDMDKGPAWNVSIHQCDVPMLVRFPLSLITDPPVATASLQ